MKAAILYKANTPLEVVDVQQQGPQTGEARVGTAAALTDLAAAAGLMDVRVVESVASPWLRLTWDPANFVQCAVRPFTDAYASLRPHLEYVQVKDAHLATGQVVPAGHGDGEVVETVRALRDDGFDGYFSLEPHLHSADSRGGFSGPDLFEMAHSAFAGLLRQEGIEFA